MPCRLWCVSYGHDHQGGHWAPSGSVLQRLHLNCGGEEADTALERFFTLRKHSLKKGHTKGFLTNGIEELDLV